MPGELGPIDIVCDAPPYAVVKACVGLGLLRPQDVRWVRIDRRLTMRQPGFFPWLRTTSPPCTCGHSLPAMESYTFTFASGAQSKYYLGQCPRCRAIYWDQD